MATRLEIAKGKLERLEKECEEAKNAAYDHMAQTNGQPMNDKRNGQSFFEKRDSLDDRVFKKMREIESQKERISLLEEREFKKENHLTANYGLQTSVKNIDELKKRKQNKPTRKKIEMLEKMVEKEKEDVRKISKKTKSIIESGAVSKWEKQPIYYFIKGLRKVAFVVDDQGEFAISKKYPVKDEDERAFVDNLLHSSM